MDQHHGLAAGFEEHRGHLRAVAYRMLGSLSEAEDAVQEAWLRLNRSDSTGVRNLGGWLTTVVARVCLDMLRARKSRREEPLDARPAELLTLSEERSDPEQEALLADSVGLALLVVLERLTPGERLAFVLHDMFALPFEEIAPIVGRSPATTRQLASRARRRVRGGGAAPGAELRAQRAAVEAFLRAARGGDLTGLLAVLDPDVVHRADRVVLPPDGSVRRGAEQVAKGALAFSRSAPSKPSMPSMPGMLPTLLLVDGAVGVVVAPRGRLARAVTFRVRDGRITEIEVIADPARLRALSLALLVEESPAEAGC